jgi:hypothetical protein
MGEGGFVSLVARRYGVGKLSPVQVVVTVRKRLCNSTPVKFNRFMARLKKLLILFRPNRGACFGSCPMNRGNVSVLSALAG